MEEEKGKLQLIYEEGYEQGWGDGYEAAISFCVNNPTAVERQRQQIYKDHIA